MTDDKMKNSNWKGRLKKASHTKPGIIFLCLTGAGILLSILDVIESLPFMIPVGIIFIIPGVVGFMMMTITAEVAENIYGRFEKVGERFNKMDERFEKMDERFDEQNKTLKEMLDTLKDMSGSIKDMSDTLKDRLPKRE